MKKVIIGLLLAIVLLVSLGVPSMATDENWEYMRMNHTDGYVAGYYTINTTNLHVTSFTIVNTTLTRTGVTRIYTGEAYNPDDLIFEIICPPNQTVTKTINNFHFHRLPHDDPDDPDSIRYPNNTFITGGDY